MNIPERTCQGTWMNLPGLRFAAVPATPFPRLRVLVPLVGTKVSAGFPSPADDHVEAVIDLNELLVRNPPATFFVRAVGVSMLRVDILDGDILVVDRSESAHHRDIVVACLDGEFTVKRLRVEGTRVWLVPESDDFPSIEVGGEQELVIWGVVTGKVSQFGRFRSVPKTSDFLAQRSRLQSAGKLPYRVGGTCAVSTGS